MEKYGYDADRHVPEDKNLTVGRIISEHRDLYKVITDFGEVKARITGKMYYDSLEETSLPAVGDFVGLDYMGKESESVIREILPRKSVFVRKAAGAANVSQTLAANFDYVFIVTSMNYDFNINRIDRYVTIAWESGGIPVIILSKADLCEDREMVTNQIELNHPGIEYHMVSNVTGEGIGALKKYFIGNRTAVFLGSSGVGKSSLLNYLSGAEMMEVKSLRSTIDKGRHTTTHRQLFVLPEGGVVVDTPGMRELGLWHADEGIEKSFSGITGQIEELTASCRFSDCKHGTEPGCAVKEALKTGALSQEQYDRYRKLQREAMHMERKISEKAYFEERKHSRDFAKKIRNSKKVKW